MGRQQGPYIEWPGGHTEVPQCAVARDAARAMRSHGQAVRDADFAAAAAIRGEKGTDRNPYAALVNPG
jgi:hypothetical protein